MVCYEAVLELSSPRLLTINERSEMGLHELPMFMSLFGFGMSIMFDTFHVCGMLFNAMLVRYVSPITVPSPHIASYDEIRQQA